MILRYDLSLQNVTLYENISIKSDLAHSSSGYWWAAKIYTKLIVFLLRMTFVGLQVLFSHLREQFPRGLMCTLIWFQIYLYEMVRDK